ncbi:MAG: hypothetical protein ACKVQJ_09990 [Pyrinomonadaceae bacterium]
MTAILVENQIDMEIDEHVLPGMPQSIDAPAMDVTTSAIELGIWLSGLESFLVVGSDSFADVDGVRATSETSKEFRLTHSALLHCARLNAILLSFRGTNEPHASPTGRELSDLATAFRDSILIGESIIRSDSLGLSEWRAWSNALSDRLTHLPAFQKLVRAAEENGEQFLPDYLKRLISGDAVSHEHVELAMILPRFAKILKWLSVIGRMLDADEPLKPALLIFSSVNEQVHELITSINNRLERFPNEEAELFATLDAASYTASVELKKVYTQELAGLALLRPSPSIYARMETAHSVLNEGFQQMLAGFARLLDPKTDEFDLFPNFKIKLDHSMVLRRKLAKLAQLARAAERVPENENLESLKVELRDFMKEKLRYLFYKDTETFERFAEEILITNQTKDLVPILHRFGAYLETLFGQVNLRAVLSKHPFETD